MAEPIRVVIADDEPPARERVLDLLASEPDIEVVAECGDGLAAADAVRRLAPDLLFLDIQMPELDGFGVLAQDGIPPGLCVIFITAYDAYALRAFEVHAADYLLKPFDRDRFKAALQRARSLLAGQQRVDTQAQLLGLLGALKTNAPMTSRVPIKTNGRVIFLRPDQIDWLEAADNYVRVHTGTETHLVRETLTDFEARLDPTRFARIHRSTVVNLDRVKELQPLFHGEYAVILDTGTRLTLSRRYRDRLQTRFGSWL